MNDREFHPDWDAEKARNHLTALRAERDKELHLHDRLMDSANGAWSAVLRLDAQIDYCERMFSAPRRPEANHA